MLQTKVCKKPDITDLKDGALRLVWVKVGATLVSEFGGAAGAALQINKLREKAFSGSKDTNKPDW